MKLNTQQIAEIDETLVLKGLIYEDIKLEITDHIATEIENRLENNPSNFKDVFEDVFNKWEGLLTPTSNAAWLGIFILAPKAVVNKMVAYSKKQIVYVLSSTFVFGTLMGTITSLIQSENISLAVNLAIKGLFSLICLATMGIMFLIWKSKNKTTYGRLFLVRSWAVLVFFYQFNIGRRNSSILEISYFWKDNFLTYSIYGFGFFYCFYQVTMALEHFKIVKKYKLT
jgi:hypothetical protein